MFVDPRFDSQPFRVVDPRFPVAFPLFVPFLHVPLVGLALMIGMMMAMAKTGVAAW